jgi:hypothetical protein
MKSKKTIDFLKSKWSILLYIILLSLSYLLQNTWQIPTTINTEKTQVLFPNDTIHVNVHQIKEHNENLRDLLQQRIAIEYAHEATRESSRQQMRGFYVLIIAGLLSIYISWKNKVTPTNIYILMVLISIIYLIEIHQNDLNQRFEAAGKIYSEKLYDVINSVNDSTTWYYFSYKDINTQMDTSSNWDERYTRKILWLLRPNAEQIALYHFPLIALLWWRSNSKANKKNGISINGNNKRKTPNKRFKPTAYRAWFF